MTSNEDKSNKFKAKKFKAKKFDPIKIPIKSISQEEAEANYVKSLNAAKKRNKAIKKFFSPLTNFFSPITTPISNMFSNKIKFVTDEIVEMPELSRIPMYEKKDFTSKIGYALSLGLKEKEIFFFGIMQWVFVILGYILWLQMLSWIPQPVWDSIQQCLDGPGDKDGCTAPADIPLMLWGILCILIVSFPIGIFSAAMGTTHFLHKQNKESTVIKCLQASLSNAWTSWSFHFIDGLITVRQIIRRLPEDNKYEPAAIKAARRAREEALYYAWKIGTAGVLPSLVVGNNLLASGKNSIKFVKARFLEIVKLRAAYSTICWIVGILAYIGAVIMMVFMGDMIFADSGGYAIVKIYQYMVFPIAMATVIVMIFLRPIYILTLCDLYSEYLESIGEEPELPNDPSIIKKAMIAFCLVCILTIFIILFRDIIGLSDILSTPIKF